MEVKDGVITRNFRTPDFLAKLFQLYSKSEFNRMNMFSEQFGYGHREILLKYCGLDYSVQLLGVLQHGLMYELPYYRDFSTPRFLNGKRTPYWVFSREMEQFGLREGFKSVKAIGAPWMYLRKATSLSFLKSQFRDKRVLVMPGHTAGAFVSKSGKELRRKRAALFREVVGSIEATVCLHANDFCDLEARESYLQQGFEVTCIGNTSLQPVWSPASSRIRMLFNLMTLLGSHSTLVTDRFGTHVFYGIDMGLKIGIFPEISELEKVMDISGRKDTAIDDKLRLFELEYIRENLPEALDGFANAYLFESYKDEVLGKHCVLDPTELKSLLQYRKNVFPNLELQPW